MSRDRLRKSVSRLNFTKAVIDGLPVPTRSRTYHYDSKVFGLCIGVSPVGRKTFFLYRKISGRPARIRIGTFPEFSLDDARRKALQLNGEIASGQNPSASSTEIDKALTFREAFERYYELHSLPKNRTAHDERLKFNRHLDSDRHGLRLAEMRLADIRRTDIAKLHANFGRRHPTSANRLLALVRSVFNRAIAWDLFDGPNPCTHIDKFPEVARERFVQADELPRLFRALDADENETIRDFLYVCLFTGARRGNVMSMQWQQLNLERRQWRIPHTKNGTPQTVPLTPEALDILARRHAAKSHSDFVFPANGRRGHLIEPKKVWARILDRATGFGLLEKLVSAKALAGDDLDHLLQDLISTPSRTLNELLELAHGSPIHIKELDMRDLRVHDLRRTMGSWQASTGASLPIIGRSLNHKSPQSTSIYARLMLDPVRESMSRATAAMMSVAGKGS